MTIRNNSSFSLVILISLLLICSQPYAQDSDSSNSIADENTVETEIQDGAPDNALANAAESAPVKIVVDDNELPSESVTPITDNKSSVLNKLIKFSGRFQLDIGTGTILDEPIINSNFILFRALYYTSENYSYGIGAKSRFGGKTTYSEQLFLNSAQLDFSRAPEPTQSQFLSFGYSFYYGKISLSKNLVVPATTKLETDFGVQTFGASTKPFLQTAINQSFFVNTHVSLGLSLGISISQITDPTSVNIRSALPVPSESSFADKIQLNQYISVNLNTIF